jgi:hypothetical protein
VRRDDPLRRLIVFDPFLQRREHIERVRPLAAAAMGHAGHHEQAI